MRINYVSWLATDIGKSFDELELPLNIINSDELVVYLEALGAGYAKAFKSKKVVYAEIAGDMVRPGEGATLAGVREITFFAPVVGG